MFSVLAKSGARLALATMIGATGFGLAATHESNLSADHSTQIEAPPLPSAAQLHADAQSAVHSRSHAGSDVQKPSTPNAGRAGADATATASAAVNGTVSSVPSTPAPPTAPSGTGSASLDGSATIGGTGQISIAGGGVNTGAVNIGSDSNGSGGLHLSLGS